jgi:uncharacterized protein
MPVLRLVLVVAALLVLVLLLRGGARRGKPPPRPGASPQRDPQPMVACAHCGVHLPKSDAVTAPSGTFCGDAHRIAYERERAGR